LSDVYTLDVLVIILGGVVLTTDMLVEKIYNTITFPAVLAGLVLALSQGEIGPRSGLGLLVGIGVMGVPFILRYGKAGDVKYMAAVGVLQGPEFVVFTLLYGSILHGVLSVILLLRRRELGVAFKNIGSWICRSVLLRSPADFTVASLGYMPHGVGLALGSFVTVWMRRTYGAVFPFWA
jgi:Flp pilus assembly protein protease CpaA